MSDVINVEGAELVSLSVDVLSPSPTNPRSVFEVDKLKELGQSMVSEGQLQPCVVRRLGERGAVVRGEEYPSAEYEIVLGERRWRACAGAGLPVLCWVRVMDDDAVRYAQHVENLQREGIGALDAARSVRVLLDVGARAGDGGEAPTVSMAAGRLGVRPSTVYGWLRLLDLPADIQAAVECGDLGSRVAELLGVLPVAVQGEAFAAVMRVPPEVPMGRREAEAFLRDTYMRSLRGVPFGLNDESLVPEAGSCAGCPRMSDNCPEIFAGSVQEARRKKVCTAPECFAAKLDAHWERMSAQAAESGKVVLSLRESARLFPPQFSAGSLAFDTGKADINAVPDAALLKNEVEGGESWRVLIEEAERELGGMVPRYVARDQRGAVRELIDIEVAMTAIEKAGEPIFRGREKAGLAKPRARRDEPPVSGGVVVRPAVEVEADGDDEVGVGPDVLMLEHCLASLHRVLVTFEAELKCAGDEGGLQVVVGGVVSGRFFGRDDLAAMSPNLRDDEEVEV